MKMSLRQLYAPALLAVALTPLAFTAQADNHEGRGMDREAMMERMEAMSASQDMSASRDMPASSQDER